MLTISVGEFKARFSDIIKSIEMGEEIVISYGKMKKKVAALIPYVKFTKQKKKRRIGILKGKASFSLTDRFKMTEEEFLRS